MLCRKFSVLLGVMALAMVAGIANADIVGTYVDADQSNTTPSSAIVTSGGENDTDNLWYQRTQTGTGGGYVLTSNGPTEDSPMLTTTVTGLANGAYNVYAVYWTNTNVTEGAWNIQAGLASEALVVYDRDNGILTGATSDGGDKTQYQALLGQVDVTTGSFSVNVDDRGITTSWMDYRSWYDGVSYQVAPEPSVLALMVTGIFGLLAYAWRKRK